MLLSFAALSLESACVKRQRQNFSPAQSTTVAAANQDNSAKPNQASSLRININAASAEELEKLPGIGKALAARIIEHREKYGPFRRPEHLIIVRGISDKRFRALRDLITVE